MKTRSGVCARVTGPVGALLLGASLWLSPFVHAANYPTREIHLITGSAVGGVPDTVARPLADKLAGFFGQPVIVENRPGAAGMLAMDLVAKAKPDGYTIGLASMSQMVFNPYLYTQLSYDPERDFVPLIKLVSGRVVIAAHPSFPASSLDGLIALARERPGKIDYAIPQSGAPPHIFGLLLAREANIDIVAIPFKTAPEAVAAAIGGMVPLVIDAPFIVAPQIKAKRLKALAVIGRDRDRLLPDTPTVAESGVSGVTTQAWLGVVVPAGVPAPIRHSLRDALARALSESELKAHFENLGWEVEGSSTEDFAESIRRERATWGPFLDKAKLRVN